MKGVSLTPLRIIDHPLGNIQHALKASEASFCGFGEAYFSRINYKATKGWKMHQKMRLNLIVADGCVVFFIRSSDGQQASHTLSQTNYQRLTVEPGYWVAFRGESEAGSIILNLASIEHDPNEAINVPIDTYELKG